MSVVVFLKFCSNGRFGDETDHLMVNELGGELALEAVYEAQAKLNLLDEKIFPLLPLQQHSPSKVSASDNCLDLQQVELSSYVRHYML